MPNDSAIINWGHLTRFASNLKDKFDEIIGNIDADKNWLNDYLTTHYRFDAQPWGVKGLNVDTSGTVYYYSRNDRLTCTKILSAVAGTTIKVNDGYQMNIYHFTSNTMTAPSYTSLTEWINEYTFDSSDDPYFMIVLKRTDGANITVAEGGQGVYEVGDVSASIYSLFTSEEKIKSDINNVYKGYTNSNIRLLFPRWWIGGVNGWNTDYTRKNRLCTPVTNVENDFIIINKMPDTHVVKVFYGTESTYNNAMTENTVYYVSPSKIGYSWFRILIYKKDDSNVNVQDHVAAEVVTSFTNITAPVINHSDTAIITFIDDDGTTSANRVKAILEDNDVTGTFAIITDNVGTSGNLTVQNLKSYASSGHDIVSHSATHSAQLYKAYNTSSGNGTNLALVDDEDIAEDLKRARDFMVKYGFNSEVIVYPFGSFPTGYNATFNNPDPSDSQVVGAYNQVYRFSNIAQSVGYDYGVNATGQMIHDATINSMYLDREFIVDSKGFDYYKNLIDQTVLQGSWLILGSHSAETNNLSDEFYEQVVAYAKEVSTVKNFKEAIAIKRNIVDICSYGHNGKTLRVGRQGVTSL